MAQSYQDWLNSVAPGYAVNYADDPRLQEAYQYYVQNAGRIPNYGDTGTPASFADYAAAGGDNGVDSVQQLVNYSKEKLTNFGANQFGYGTPLTIEQHNQLKAQLDAIPNLPDDFKKQVLTIPQEGWSDPKITNIVNYSAQQISANPDSASGAGGNYGIVSQIAQNGFGLPGGRPISDLFNPVQNVGAANAGMAALGSFGLAAGVEGVGAGLGLGDTATVPAGAVGGGGAQGVGFGTTLGGGAEAPIVLEPPIDPSTGFAGSYPPSGPIDPATGFATNPVGVGAGATGGTAAGTATGTGTAAGSVGTTGVAAGTAGGIAGGTAISRIVDGTATTADWTSVLGNLGATGLGIFGANQQQNALTDLANKLYGAGAPSRARFESSMTPGFDPTSIPGYQGALDTSSESILRKLSATQGNPYGSPGGLIEANKAIIGGTALPAIQAYQNQNAAAGGFSGFANAFPSAATGAVGATGNIYNAIGSGLANLTNPPPNYSGLLNNLFKGLT